jgi:hypothetical protein
MVNTKHNHKLYGVVERSAMDQPPPHFPQAAEPYFGPGSLFTDCCTAWYIILEHLPCHYHSDWCSIPLQCNKCSAYTERLTPPIIKEETPHLTTYISRREKKSWSQIFTRPEAKKDSAGEGQQQFN